MSLPGPQVTVGTATEAGKDDVDVENPLRHVSPMLVPQDELSGRAIRASVIYAPKPGGWEARRMQP